MTRTCKYCDGTGKVWVRPCRHCQGKGSHEQPDPKPSGKVLKPREEVAAFIEHLFDGAGIVRGYDKGCTHVGRVEFRELMDFLYGEPPTNVYQEVK